MRARAKENPLLKAFQAIAAAQSRYEFTAGRATLVAFAKRRFVWVSGPRTRPAASRRSSHSHGRPVPPLSVPWTPP